MSLPGYGRAEAAWLAEPQAAWCPMCGTEIDDETCPECNHGTDDPDAAYDQWRDEHDA